MAADEDQLAFLPFMAKSKQLSQDLRPPQVQFLLRSNLQTAEDTTSNRTNHRMQYNHLGKDTVTASFRKKPRINSRVQNCSTEPGDNNRGTGEGVGGIRCQSMSIHHEMSS